MIMYASMVNVTLHLLDRRVLVTLDTQVLIVIQVHLFIGIFRFVMLLLLPLLVTTGNKSCKCTYNFVRIHRPIRF